MFSVEWSIGNPNWFRITSGLVPVGILSLSGVIPMKNLVSLGSIVMLGVNWVISFFLACMRFCSILFDHIETSNLFIYYTNF